MQVYLHLYCLVQARLCFNNNFFITLQEQTKTKVKVTFFNNIFIEFTPINTSSLSNFLCELHFSGSNLVTKSENVTVIKLNADNYYLIFNPKKQNIGIQQNNTQEISLKGKKIIYSLGKLEIFDKTRHEVFQITNSTKDFTINEQNGLIILFCKELNKNNLHIISLLNFTHLTISAETYQIKGNELQCIKNLYTFAKHKKIMCFDIVTLNKTKEFTAYKEEPNINLPKKIIPYAFMQCIQVQDYKLAHKFLDENIFKGELTKQKIQGFFNDFYMVTTPQIPMPENTICLVYKEQTTNTKSCKYFTFEYNFNNKITNIKPCI